MTASPFTVDARGRLALGREWAHRLVLLTRVGQDRIEIEWAEAVPAREARAQGSQPRPEPAPAGARPVQTGGPTQAGTKGVPSRG